MSLFKPFLTAVAMLFLFPAILPAQTWKPIPDDCVMEIDEGAVRRYIRLSGTVKVLSDPWESDFRVKLVFGREIPDLRVKKTSKPSACGEWMFVPASFKDPDFTITFVEEGEDFSIKYVDEAPGVVVF